MGASEADEICKRMSVSLICGFPEAEQRERRAKGRGYRFCDVEAEPN